MLIYNPNLNLLNSTLKGIDSGKSECWQPASDCSSKCVGPVDTQNTSRIRANVRPGGVGGMTALIHACRRDITSFASVLLEYVQKSTRHKQLHRPLWAMLLHITFTMFWSDKSTGGLNTVSLHGWEILIYFEPWLCTLSSIPWRLQIICFWNTTLSSPYILGDLISRLNAHPDAMEKLIGTFDDLSRIINGNRNQDRAWRAYWNLACSHTNAGCRRNRYWNGKKRRQRL